MGLFNKLKTALSKTSSKISNSLDYILVKKKLDEQTLEELEDLLITADIGVSVAAEITTKLRKNKFDKEVTIEEVKEELSKIIAEILAKQNHEFIIGSASPTIILVSGVNGNGKTTSIAKLAAKYISEGKKVAVAACDTFRAAAIEQLEQWTTKVGAIIYKAGNNADPASVAYMAVDKAKEENVDILFIDTAGRLHNYNNLMAELEKIIRVIKKIIPDAPHHSLLVIDGTTGQNAITQTAEFKDTAAITGLIVTKLDGTAKAGVMVGIVDKFALPVHFIGIGEKMDDLKPFIPEEFAKALIS